MNTENTGVIILTLFCVGIAVMYWEYLEWVKIEVNESNRRQEDILLDLYSKLVPKEEPKKETE